MKYNWICHPTDNAKSKTFSEQLNISPIIAQILINRGIENIQAAQTFFSHSLKDLHNPFLMKDMEKAVNKIVSILDKTVSQPNNTLDSKITVYGDYDVDGTTGTALLVTFFRELGIKAQYYIPERQAEGYGLNKEAIKKIAASGARLIISVDCGISSYNEIVEALEAGIDIIITDHHEIPDKLPPAFAVLNPSQQDCAFPCKNLSGVGVVFKLITALRNRLRENPYFKDKLPNLKKHLDLTALGTIADITPLKDENRIIVYHGLKELTNTRKHGIGALKKAAGCDNKEIDTSDVGFLLGPRLNAAGRLETADMAVKALLSEDGEEAKKIAEYLDKTNRERQAVQAEIFSEAVEIIESNPRLNDNHTIVLASENWHSGVIGIVASKLIDKYYRPTILIAVDGSTGKASGRSIEGFNLYDGLCKCGGLLKKYGGHKMAVGFSIEKDMIDEFRELFEEESRKTIQDKDIFTPPLKIDAEAPFDELTKKLNKELETLSPFGFGNPRPLLMAKNVSSPIPPKVIGKSGDHLKLKFKGGKNVIEAIGFNMGDLLGEFDFENDRFDIAFTLSINKWKNMETLQLKLKDIRLADKQ